MRKSRKAEQAVLQAAWNTACGLYQHLLAGGQLEPIAPTLRLDPDERAFTDAPVGVAGFFAYDRAQTTQMLGPWLNTHDVRREIADLMTPKWRGHRTVRGVVTDQRLLINDQTWQSLWHENLLELTGDADQWTFILEYEEAPPLMLFGPASPYFAIMMAWLTYGRQGLDLPSFRPIAAAVADNATPPQPPSAE